jgi:hypothetical protein
VHHGGYWLEGPGGVGGGGRNDPNIVCTYEEKKNIINSKGEITQRNEKKHNGIICNSYP